MVDWNGEKDLEFFSLEGGRIPGKGRLRKNEGLRPLCAHACTKARGHHQESPSFLFYLCFELMSLTELRAHHFG